MASLSGIQRELERLYQAITSGEVDDGSIREFLLAEAGRFHDAYAIVQDSASFFRGVPVEYSPTVAEWRDFPSLLEKLHFMDTKKVGVALITLDPETPGIRKPSAFPLSYSVNGRRFKIKMHNRNSDYLGVQLETEGALYRSEDRQKTDPCYRIDVDITAEKIFKSVGSLVRSFESSCKNAGGYFTTPVYATDKDVESKEHRQYYQLPPQSAIHPLAGNSLDRTINKISGIHTPWAYISSGPYTPFSLHKEDADTNGINHLVAGHRKVWFVIAPHHAEKLEDLIAEELEIDDKHRACDQWIRHLNVYIPRGKLEERGIHYCVFAQRVDQVVITFPQAYHQGFNAGTNVADAVDYGDKYWNPDRPKGRDFCSKRHCGHAGPDVKLFAFREDHEEQKSPEVQDPEVIEHEIEPPNKKTRADLPRRENTSSGSGLHKATASKTAASTTSTISKPMVAKSTPSSAIPPKVGAPKTASNVALPKAAPPKSAPLENAANSARSLVSSTEVTIPISGSIPTATNEDVSNEPEISGLARWKEWEAKREQSTGRKTLSFRPTKLFETLSKKNVLVRGKSRPPISADIERVVALVTSFGSAESFQQLQDVIRHLRISTSTMPTGVTESAYFTMVLDMQESNYYCLAIRTHINQAKFAESVDQRLLGPRPVGTDDSFITLVYKEIMKEAYPHLALPNSGRKHEYSARYNQLQKRYRDGKRWLAVAARFSWQALLFFPKKGLCNINEGYIQRLDNALFEIFLDLISLEKQGFAEAISKSGIVGTNGVLVIPRKKLLLEDASFDYIGRCSDASGDLVKLLGTRQ
jgi:hypothetical protein